MPVSLGIQMKSAQEKILPGGEAIESVGLGTEMSQSPPAGDESIILLNSVMPEFASNRVLTLRIRREMNARCNSISRDD